MEFRQIGPDGVRSVKLPQWLFVVIALGISALALVLLVLAAGAALVVLPILALISLVYGWWMRRKIGTNGGLTPKRGQETQPQRHDVIDADFIVLDPPEQRNRAPRDDKNT